MPSIHISGFFQDNASFDQKMTRFGVLWTMKLFVKSVPIKGNTSKYLDHEAVETATQRDQTQSLLQRWAQIRVQRKGCFLRIQAAFNLKHLELTNEVLPRKMPFIAFVPLINMPLNQINGFFQYNASFYQKMTGGVLWPYFYYAW